MSSSEKKALPQSESNDSKFVGPSLFLFLDYLVVSVGSWLYWIVISKFATVAEIGLATTVYSLVVLTSILTQLGIEYPLLKRAKTDGDQILGTALLIETIVTAASLPIIFLVTNNLYGGSTQEFQWIASILLLVLSIEFIFRFCLLGISDSKKVLITDSVGQSIKFLAGFSLTLLGYGTYGILIAYLLEVIFIVSIYFVFINKMFSFSLGNLKYMMGIFRTALVNTPSKYSGQIIFNLSVVLLAAFGLDSSDVGLFYIALIISVFIGSIASSMAFMVIPASTSSSQDLSSESLRISLSLISPIVVIMLVSPNLVLSLIGPQYEVAAPVLFVLSICILPYAITINAISKLNNMDKPRSLLSLGFVQMFTFLISFMFLVPYFGTIGAAYSILISSISSSILALNWLPRASLRNIAVCCLSIIVAAGIGYAIGSLTDNSPTYPFIIVILFSVVVCILIILKFRIISVGEITHLFKTSFQRN